MLIPALLSDRLADYSAWATVQDAKKQAMDGHGYIRQHPDFLDLREGKPCGASKSREGIQTTTTRLQ
jgi:hypothetical protein